MNKLAIVLIGLCLSACVTEPDVRPEPYLKSEALLQEGLNAYHQDNFSEATEKFDRALVFYTSFDNHRGMALARLNLLEVALASSDFVSAKLYLTQLKQQGSSNDLEPDLQRKLRLLEVKLQFDQQQYQTALTTLLPLLVALDREKQPDDERLNLLAMQARLEVLISPLAKSSGLVKFETALAQVEPQPPHYQMVLKRILAVMAFKQGHYKAATSLLTEALVYYKSQANRRAIALCLEELATVELTQKHQVAAQAYLNRALLIWQWLKNDYKSNKIRLQLGMDKK